MSFFKNKLMLLLSTRKKKQFSNNSLYECSTQFDWTSSCSNGTANKENITIGGDCWIRGSLTVTGNGRITIGDRTYIGGATRIGALQEIKIGNDVIIYDNNNHPVEPEKRIEITEAKDYSSFLWGWNENVERKRIVINDNVWIGERTTILKGVVIGKGAVVGCNSVVTHDVPERCVVAGNPAKIVKML